MKRIIPIIILLLIIAPVTALNDDAWPEAMEDWDHRVPITITDPPADGVQRMVTVTFQEGMQADFDDIRTYTSAGSAIDYWIEDYTASTSVDVWYEQPSTDTYFYVYYDNAEATDASDGNAVFEFYDDFPGSSLDATKWDYTNDPTVSVSDGEMTFTQSRGETDHYIQSKTALGVDHVFGARQKVYLSSSMYGATVGFGARTSPTKTNFAVLAPYSVTSPYGRVFLQICDGSTLSSASLDDTLDTNYHTIEVARNSTTSVTYTRDGTLKKTHTSGVSSANLKPTIGSSYCHGTIDSKSTFDWVYVRKYDTADTSFSIGTPEEPSAADVVPFPGFEDNPTDPDGDGLYEDCNGNGRIDFNDVLVLFQNTAWAQANQPTISYFDWSGNGKIEFSDVVAFWESDY